MGTSTARDSPPVVSTVSVTLVALYNQVMARDAAELLKEALALPVEARAALAGSLLQSLDTEADENAEEAWQEEILKRLGEIDSGAVRLIPWDEARRRLKARIRA